MIAITLVVVLGGCTDAVQRGIAVGISDGLSSGVANGLEALITDWFAAFTDQAANQG